MKFATLLTLASVALAAPTPVTKNFVLKANIETENFKDQEIKFVEAHPHVFNLGGDGSTIHFQINDDGTLYDVDSERAIFLSPNSGELGLISPWNDQAPTVGFSLEDNKLKFADSTTWRACPSGDGKFSVTLAKFDCLGGSNFEAIANY